MCAFDGFVDGVAGDVVGDVVGDCVGGCADGLELLPVNDECTVDLEAVILSLWSCSLWLGL